jgi:uncharacterized protein (TIGR02118 family)
MSRTRIIGLPAKRATAMSAFLSGKCNFSKSHRSKRNQSNQGGIMIRVSVLYPKKSDSTFDMDYYLNKHVPMVVSRLTPTGLVKGEIDEGMGGFPPGQPAPYAVVGYLTFERMEDFQLGFARHGAEIMGDVPNFTNIQPVVQISRVALS